MSAAIIRALTAMGAVVAVLASVAVFTAPFTDNSGPALIWMTVAVLAAAALLTIGFVVLYTYLGKKVTAPVAVAAALVIVLVTGGLGVGGYAAWHHPATHTVGIPKTPATGAEVAATSTPVKASVPSPAMPAVVSQGVPPTGTIRYDQAAGPGCAEPGGGTTGKADENHGPEHPWTARTAATGDAGSCTEALLSSELNQNLNIWLNEYTWTFARIPPDAHCWFSVYIADSPYSHYSAAQYYWKKPSDANYPSDPSFEIDQAADRGKWVVEYNTPVTVTGVVQLVLTDAGTGAGETVAASVARLQCT